MMDFMRRPPSPMCSTTLTPGLTSMPRAPKASHLTMLGSIAVRLSRLAKVRMRRQCRKTRLCRGRKPRLESLEKAKLNFSPKAPDS